MQVRVKEGGELWSRDREISGESWGGPEEEGGGERDTRHA